MEIDFEGNVKPAPGGDQEGVAGAGHEQGLAPPYHSKSGGPPSASDNNDSDVAPAAGSVSAVAKNGTASATPLADAAPVAAAGALLVEKNNMKIGCYMN